MLDIAEQLYRRYEALPNIRDGKVVRAMFLGRRATLKRHWTFVSRSGQTLVMSR